MLPIIRFKNYDEFLEKGKAFPFINDLIATVDRKIQITIKPFQEKNNKNWKVGFYAGRNRFADFGISTTWKDCLDQCDAFAEIIPNAKVDIKS